MWVFLRVEWETVKELDARERLPGGGAGGGTRSPPPGTRAGPAAAAERREAYREPIFDHDEFEMVPPQRGAELG